MPPLGDILLSQGQRASRCDFQLLPYKIGAGSHLCDWMFHLEAGIYLQKIKFP